jgi:hypothetical protein
MPLLLSGQAGRLYALTVVSPVRQSCP